MPGLLNDPNALNQPPAGDPADAPQPGEAPDQNQSTVPDSQGEAATPEEQTAYDEFVKTGYDLMYAGGKVNPGILKMLDEDPNDLISALGAKPEEFQHMTPTLALAATACIITLKACEKTGEKDGTIILHGGKAILEDLVEIAGKAGVHDYSEEEMSQAMRMGADLFREAGAAKGIVNLDQAKQEWGQITEADKAGKLGDVLPALASAAPPPDPQQQQAPAPDQGVANGP